MLKNCFKVTDFSNFQSIALLILRLIAGIAFLYHGWGKIQTPFSWMPWSESDPNVKTTYSGPEEGVGSTSSWNGYVANE